MPLVVCEGVSKRYGGVTAVNDVSLAVRKGETVGIIGSNGAGKSTLFALLTGFERPDKGAVYLERAAQRTLAVHRTPAYRLARAGVGRTFQNLRLFEALTVRDNVRTAVCAAKRTGFDADALLLFMKLDKQASGLAGALPYGAKKRCELARAVAVAAAQEGCGLLFLDEPCAGLCREETEELLLLLQQLKQRYELTVVVIEHNMEFVAKLCGRMYAMDTGKIIAQGLPDAVLRDGAVRRLILGEQPAP